MYQQLHYPTWTDSSGIWFDTITNTDDELVGIKLLHAAIVTGNRYDWGGVIGAEVLAINPLNLKFPDISNSTENIDSTIIEEGMHSGQISPEDIPDHWNFDLMIALVEATSNAADMLGLYNASGPDSWFSGAGARGEYRDGESGEEAWNRIAHDHPSLDLLAEMVAEGDYQSGLLANVVQQQELPEVMPHETLEYSRLRKLAIQRFLSNGMWGHRWREYQDDMKCDRGYYHDCRQHTSKPVTRGHLSLREGMKYQIKLAIEETQSDEEFNDLDMTALRNFRTLIQNYYGEKPFVISDFKIVDHDGTGVLQWQNDPNTFMQVVLSSDNSMTLTKRHEEIPNPSNSGVEPSALFNITTGFDADQLIKFIDHKEIPNLD